MATIILVVVSDITDKVSGRVFKAAIIVFCSLFSHIHILGSKDTRVGPTCRREGPVKFYHNPLLLEHMVRLELNRTNSSIGYSAFQSFFCAWGKLCRK